MQLSDIPEWTPKKFANDATGTYIREVPQTTADPAAASFSLGFPPQTFTDEGAGGTPPDGRDFNGILNYLSAWAQWVGLGGPVPYDATVSSAGGYPKGARVQSVTNPPRIWLCTIDNNTTNPDSGGAGWVSDVSVTYQDFTTAGSGNVTVPVWATHAEVHVIGGGGAGASIGTSWTGGGGGAGGHGCGVISVTPGAAMPYVVGAGGTQAGGIGLPGTAGAASSFGGITAQGGGGGSSSSTVTAGGAGGSCSGAPRNFTGNDGGDGNLNSLLVQGGNGAGGPFGGAGRSGAPAGNNGHAPGAGGGGAWGSAGGGGGQGAPGAVLIRWLP